MKRAVTRIEGAIGNLWSLFAVSLVIAGLGFIFFDAAPKVSALLTLVWIAVVIPAFTKFKRRAFWLLLGTPLVGYWFVVVYVIASGCSQNIKNCP
ncbi:MAG TPA: hypothetical protein VMS18_14535 [Candidatus Binatia bacterium]|nr:hypothetical protein [Candidatus Binatia bacterium]